MTQSPCHPAFLSFRGVWGWACSLPQPPVLRAGGPGALPFFLECLRCRRGGPSPTRQCTPLRAAVVRCWGGRRAAGEVGGPCLHEGSPGLGTLPPPTAVLGAGDRGQTHIAGSCELALCGSGLVRGHPVWGASSRRVACLELSTLPPPTARPCGRWPRPTARSPLARGWRPSGAHTCKVALCAVRAAGGHPEGRASCLCGGKSGGGHSSSPNRPPSGQAAMARCPMSSGAGAAAVGDCHQPNTVRSSELA